MRKYSITAEDWNKVRGEVTAFSPRDGANWLRPIDILKTNLKNKQELYTKFQSMVLQESRHMVPVSTVEAQVSLRGTSRPTTLGGTLAYSFSAFKNFPLTYTMLYSRMGLRAETAGGRAGFYAGLAAAATLGGVVAAQLSETAKGRDLLDWSDPRLWGKGFAKGGGAGILGDFLFADVGEYGQDIGDVVTGPSLGLYGDVTALAFGDAFKVVNELAKNGDLQNYDSKTGERAVQLARRYTPGSNLWYSAPIIQRKFWDAIENAADPKAQRKRDNRMRKQERDFGNEYWWPLGAQTPERMPDFKVE